MKLIDLKNNKNNYYNLIIILLGQDSDYEIIDNNVEENINQVLKQLMPKEEEVIRLYYINGLTITQISQKMRITQPQARDYKNMGLRKLNHPLVSDYIINGVDLTKKKPGANLVNLSIEEFDYLYIHSSRVYNSLKRHGINNVSELVRCSKNDLFKFKGIGKGTVKKIAAALDEISLCLKQDE